MKKIQFLFALVCTTFCSALLAQPVAMVKSVDYASGAKIQNNIKQECTELGAKISSFAVEFGKKSGVEIVLSDTVDTSAQGQVLEVYITDAVSRGNAWTGHRKYVSVSGSLFENGVKVASFTGGRFSGGGAFAGYKGSCSVLGRCSKAIGKDIANWLAEPEDGASLGDG